jgi:hypothetical protein
MDKAEKPMNNKLEDLMYQSGLTAQGCWDEMDDYDHEAIEKLAELIVRECAKQVNNVYKQGGGTYSETILKNFGIKI